jgi:outer membrane protein
MRCLRLVALLAIPAQVLSGQQPSTSVPSALTLEDAVAIAARNNPGFLQTQNQLKTADIQVRSAYGALLPSANANFSTRYQQGGTQFIQGVQLGGSGDTKQSSYSLGVNYFINGSAIYAPGAAKANRAAAEASIVDGKEVLRSFVTQQYITVLQAQSRAALQDTLVNTAAGQLELAKARTAVGVGTALDIRRAEVALGQAQVQAINAHNLAEVEMLRLFQQLGIVKNGDVVLTTKFPITTPTFSLDSVLTLARQVNPAVASLRANERSSALTVKAQRSRYFPSLSIGTGWGGNSFQYADAEFPVAQARAQLAGQQRSCYTTDSIRTRIGMPGLGCDRFVLTDEAAAAIRSDNNNFPFKFNRNPVGVSAFFSLPIFDNFQREQAVEQAQVTHENARYTLKARELQLTTEVTQAYLNLKAASQTVALQEQNAARAQEELQFAEERYRVGAVTFLDVTTSRGTYEQASIDRVNSIYDYHKAFAALESAVGRPLR